MQPDANVIGGRYLLHDQLGTGGMGVVYRATDRLSGETVALKRVTALAEQLQLESQGDASGGSDALRLILANEFQILASLRHPHIISVLDYGFDAERRPYFTMEYLDQAQTILEVGKGQSVSARVDLLIQVLQALAYLHRRGTLHRDLKPGNVLVVNQTARVLDFGLSVARDQASGTVGTLAYMAPEVLLGDPADEAADLYVVGVLAYQLFAGRHPFDTADQGQLLSSMLSSELDLAALKADDRLVQVIARLLEREPASRYASAEACIAAFSHALGQPPPQESVSVRESYLQAAKFVGREAELGRLTGALEQALAGAGSAWLVGGENGVGKSRLLDELRTRALVKGTLVLRGQGVSEGGASYQLWREPLRRLALTTELSDLEAGILRPIVPDISALLDRSIPVAPEMGGAAGQHRLLVTIGRVLRRQSSPALLLLEDLQWANESLEALKYLNRMVTGRPLLIVGSYQDDERPGLADELPDMQVIKLDRLSAADIAELSQSMLGAAGAKPEILDLLQRETEGNAFFLVEVMRALADKAGRLTQVATMALPARVFPQGVQTIVQQRLARVPAPAQALLQLAATAGRQLDLRVIALLADGRELDEWLITCANAAVLEIYDGRWRFAHEKLREGLLGALDVAEQVLLHRQVAQAVESAYPHDPEQAAVLAYHWGIVGDVERERCYARLAGEHAAAQFANAMAITHFNRALELTPGSDYVERYAILLAREKVNSLQGARKAQAQDLAALEELADVLDDPSAGSGQVGRRAEVALRRANYAQMIGDYAVAIAAARTAIDLASHAPIMDEGDSADETGRAIGPQAMGYLQWGRALWRQGDHEAARLQLEQALALARSGQALAGLLPGRSIAPLRQVEADSLLNLGVVSGRQSDYLGARTYLEQSLRIYHETGDRRSEGIVLSNLGIVSAEQGDHAGARGYFEQSLLVCRETGARRSEGNVLNNLGVVSLDQGDYAGARGYYEQALRIFRQTGDCPGEIQPLVNLGRISRDQGDYAGAKAYYEQTLLICREVGDREGAGTALSNLGLLYHQLGDDEAARTHSQQALLMAQELGNRLGQGNARTCLGHALAGLGHLDEAANAYRQALTLRRDLGQSHLAVESLAGLARVSLARGDLAPAQAQVAEILSYLNIEGNTLEGAAEPLRVYLTCYCVLRASHDPRAGEILDTAYSLLQERATKIGDEEMRRSFLENVVVHREIVSEWRLWLPERNGSVENTT